LTTGLFEVIIQFIQLKFMKKAMDNKRPERIKGWLILLVILTWIFCSFDIWSDGNSVNHEDCSIEQYWSYSHDGAIYNSKGATFKPPEISNNINEEIPC